MIASFAQQARRIAPGLALLAALCLAAGARAASSPVKASPVKPATGPALIIAPAAERAARESGDAQTAILAGGSYWTAEAVFSHVVGVSSVVSGQAGSPRGLDPLARFRGPRPQGDPRPADAVRLVYDPAKIRFDDLLRIYFTIVVDPTQRAGQPPLPAPRYRSLLVPTSQEQLLVASAYLSQLRASELWKDPITTRIEPTRRFTPADAEFQDFLIRNPDHPEVARTIAPRLALLRRHFPQFYKGGFTPD